MQFIFLSTSNNSKNMEVRQMKKLLIPKVLERCDDLKLLLILKKLICRQI